MRIEMVTFLLAGAICLGGALGVVLFSNPVHNALSLVATLFGVAVLFIAQEAYFLAAIQVIVYAGAIVVLFLFVIMLLGVDRAQKMGMDPIVGQRASAVVCGVAILGLSLAALLAGSEAATGTPSATAPLDPEVADINRLGEVLFTDYVFAFQITAVLLTIAVVGAVVLARKAPAEAVDLDEFPDGTAMDAIDERRLDDVADHDATDDGAAERNDPAEPRDQETGGPGEAGDESEEVAT